jgi:PTH1 family peptidyl-tRNA hydrolase
MKEENNQFLIIGLGNFGKKYFNNRHNAGFLVLDFLIKELEKLNQKENLDLISDFEFKEQKKFFGEICEIKMQDKKFFFLKPLTYMNLSGKSALLMKNFYKIDIKNILVIHDELDFSPFKSRFKNGGGEGGHNGLKSISSCFGLGSYLRLRIGVGKPGASSDDLSLMNMSVSDYVLSDLSQKEIEFISQISKFLCNNFFDLFLNQDQKNLNKIFQKISEIK